MDDRPFALLGVNTDRDRELVKKLNEQNQITWRSFFDGGTSGPITTAWGVGAFPTLVVIDHEGRIAHRDLTGDALDAAIEALVQKAEAAAEEGR